MIASDIRIIILVLLAYTSYACLSKSVKGGFERNLEEFNRVALLVRDSFPDLYYAELQKDSLLFIFKDGEEKLEDTGRVPERERNAIADLMINNNLVYILNQDERITFDYRNSCFDAINFPKGNQEYVELLKRHYDDWYRVYGDHWVLEKGECYSID